MNSILRLESKASGIAETLESQVEIEYLRLNNSWVVDIGKAMNTAQWVMNSKVGRLYLVASDKGLQSISWEKQTAKIVKSLKGKGTELKILSQAVQELDEYFNKKRIKFDIPLDIQGTPFQKQVWARLSKIPYGKMISYQGIAIGIKKPKAFRAVGTANGKNPLPIVIPCHRVIASNGSLGGYSAGLDLKVELLHLEQCDEHHHH